MKMFVSEMFVTSALPVFSLFLMMLGIAFILPIIFRENLVIQSLPDSAFTATFGVYEGSIKSAHKGEKQK